MLAKIGRAFFPKKKRPDKTGGVDPRKQVVW